MQKVVRKLGIGMLRILGFILLLALLLLYVVVVNALLFAVWAGAAVVGLGILWVLDNYVHEGISDSPLMILAFWIFPWIWFAVAFFYGSILTGIDSAFSISRFLKPLLRRIGEATSKLIDFVFESGQNEKAGEYIQLYGRDFPEPTFEAFQLEPEEYYSFNRRFSLSGFIGPSGVFAGIAVGWYITSQPGVIRGLHFEGMKNIGIAVAAGLGVSVVLWSAEQILSRRFAQRTAVLEYEKARDVYNTIQMSFGNHWSRRFVESISRKKPPSKKA